MTILKNYPTFEELLKAQQSEIKIPEIQHVPLKLNQEEIKKYKK